MNCKYILLTLFFICSRTIYAYDCNRIFHNVSSAISALEYEKYPLSELFADLNIGESIVISVPRNIKNQTNVKNIRIGKSKRGGIELYIEPKLKGLSSRNKLRLLRNYLKDFF